MLAKAMKVGFPGMVLEVPFPASGMGHAHNADVELTDLLNGTKHAFSAPVSYQTMNWSWRAGTPALQPILDLYNKRWGNREFYILNPNAKNANLLPPRWAYSYQLAHLAAGQGQPYVDTATVIPESVFNGTGWGAFPPAIKVMATKGRAHYLKAWGVRTGTLSGIRYRKHTPGTGWSAWAVHTPTMANDAPTTVLSEAESMTVDFIELALYVTTGAVLRLQHMDLSLEDYRSFPNPQRPGEGLGALKFSGVADAELVSARTQRIGLSLDVTEVEYQRV